MIMMDVRYQHVIMMDVRSYSGQLLELKCLQELGRFDRDPDYGTALEILISE